MIYKDILIIGSGIAGLSFALKIAKERPDLSICILTKKSKTESNTRYAQGGIAVVLDKITDSYQQHIDDTLKSGGGLCNKKIVRMVVKKAAARLKELINWGVEFDKQTSGEFSTGLEGGHSHARILHHKDITGFEIEKKLILQISQYSNITLLDNHFALDIITTESIQNNIHINTCYGAYVLNQQDNSIKIFTSRITLLATGGSGQVYQTTTNPSVATGDGVAIAQRAGAKIKDMQFVQFHPTAFYKINSNPSFLISEAVRGFGAWLVNKNGVRFVLDYDERGELATRDIVSKAIYFELLKSHEDNVYLDCRHLDMKEFKKHFPSIYNHCKKNGIDLYKDQIPVAPAAHYQCGGISINAKAQTSIVNLYACGECSHTGLHGSNRLASNSLLEAIVFSHEAYLHIFNKIDYVNKVPHLVFKKYPAKKANLSKINNLKKELKALMNLYAGIVKTSEGLILAHKQLLKLDLLIKEKYQNVAPNYEIIELKNLMSVAHLIVNQSFKYINKRKINRNNEIETDINQN